MSFAPKSNAEFGDFSKLFSDMKIPAVPDVAALISANRRNMEALTAANRIALEGGQAIARRHQEIMQQSMAEVAEAIRAMSSVEAPQAKVAKQAELLKQTYGRAIANLQEMSDLIQHSTAEAVKLLNARFMEAVEEVKALADKSKA